MNQRPVTFGESPKRSGVKPRPNDLSAQAALTINMANAIMKVRKAVEEGVDVKLTPDEGRVLLLAIRQSISQAKAMQKSAKNANERARRARRK